MCIDLKRLARLDRRPPLFSGTRLSFWTDPYISSHILNAHLDPTTEDASRPPDVIAATADWIAARVDAGNSSEASGPTLLDLACGPGLYCTEFARRGFSVHGIDFSRSSIEYAEREAQRNNVLITYDCADYRKVSFRARFDVVTLIFGEFCVMTNRDRDRMLRSILAALRPGGLFIFDVFSRAYTRRTALKTGWYPSISDGFWMQEPHLVFERGIEYEDDCVHLNQYIVAGQDSEPRVYNIWRHHYTPDSIRTVLHGAGFHVDDLYKDLSGTSLSHESEWIGVVARKPQ